MIFDNLLVNALCREFKQKILKAKIERVFQIDRSTFIIRFWKDRKHFNLFISLNPLSYRANISNGNYKDNKFNSPIIIQLKKNLESGIVLDIQQLNFDRILSFKIESYDIVRDKVIYHLILELTGKYSNLILTDQNNKILGAYRQIDEEQNQERQILAGSSYAPITNKSNKLDLKDLNRDLFYQKLKEKDLRADKFLVSNFLGISGHTAMLLINNPQNNQSKISALSESELENIYHNLSTFANCQKSDNLYLKMINKDNPDFYLGSENDYTEGISEFIDSYYLNLENKQKFELLKSELNKVIEKNLDKINYKISIQEDTLKKSEDAELYKLYGELLFANMYQLPEKSSLAVLENYYEDNKKIEINLDENLSISENAQKFLKKYNKLKNSQVAASKLISEFRQELFYFEEVKISLDNAEDTESLRDIEAELAEQKLINKKYLSKKSKMADKPNFHSFRTSNGLEILVGKNNTQNDLLTNKFASPNDIWLHTRLIPGSHVILRTENGQKEIDQESLTEAAKIAAKYSKAKYSSNVCVIYTKVKNIKKPPRSRPGFVLYSNEKAIYVTPDL